MAKVFTPDGKFWIEQEGTTARIGLAADYLEKVGVVWNFVPRQEYPEMTIGRVFANIETSKRLVTLRSPINGKVEGWPALDLESDKITSDTPLIALTEVR